jgi:hypothetical protein
MAVGHIPATVIAFPFLAERGASLSHKENVLSFSGSYGEI